MSQLPELRLEPSFKDKVGDRFYVPVSGTIKERGLAEAFNRQIEAFIDFVATQGPTPHKNDSEQAKKRKKYEWQLNKITRALKANKSGEIEPFRVAFTDDVVGKDLVKTKEWAGKLWKKFKKDAFQGSPVDYPAQVAAFPAADGQFPEGTHVDYPAQVAADGPYPEDVTRLSEDIWNSATLAGAANLAAGGPSLEDGGFSSFDNALLGGATPASAADWPAGGSTPDEEEFSRLTNLFLGGDGGSTTSLSAEEKAFFDRLISETREDAAGSAAADQGIGHAAAPEPLERTNSQMIQSVVDMLDAPAPVEREASMPDSQGSLFGGSLNEEWSEYVFGDK